MPEPFPRADILVRQIDAAREGNATVHGNDFAVVTVVLNTRKERTERIEHAALDALPPQIRRKFRRQSQKASDVVPDHADIHTLGNLAHENLMDGIPEHALADDEILQKDIALRPLQFLQQRGLIGLSVREIFGFGISADREARHVPQIADQSARVGILDGGGVGAVGDKPVGVRRFLLLFVQALAVSDRGGLVMEEPIEHRAEHGKEQDQEHHGNFEGGVVLAVSGQMECRQKAGDPPQNRKPPQLRIKRDAQPDKRDLCQQEQRHKSPAEQQFFQSS